MTPVIFEGTRLTIPLSLSERLRKAAEAMRHDVLKFDRETWVTYKPLGLHQDITAAGLVTFGVILANDRGLLLAYEDCVYDAPPGTLYRIDARRPHGALAYKADFKDRMCFAFLAWDVPAGHSIHRFASDAIVAIARKTRGEAPRE